MKKKLLSRRLQPHRKANKFFNEPGETFSNVFGHTALMLGHLLKNFKKRRPKNPDRWHAPATPPARSKELLITWIGHASFLLQVDNINILLDPTFFNSSCLFPRILPPGLMPEELPTIDYVLLSHNHRDHMDKRSLKAIYEVSPKAVYMVPEGDKLWFERYGLSQDQVHEYSWWESGTAKGVNFTFLPAYHWSQRSLFDRNRSLWGSWMIEIAGQTIYFGGDTANWHHFGQIAKQFPVIDVALMPIGPCEPRKWMEKSHLSPEQAGEAFLTLNAKHFIPMHWGTFYFGVDYYEQPIERMSEWWQNNLSKLDGKVFHLNKMGEPFNISVPNFHISHSLISDIQKNL